MLCEGSCRVPQAHPTRSHLIGGPRLLIATEGSAEAGPDLADQCARGARSRFVVILFDVRRWSFFIVRPALFMELLRSACKQFKSAGATVRSTRRVHMRGALQRWNDRTIERWNDGTAPWNCRQVFLIVRAW